MSRTLLLSCFASVALACWASAQPDLPSEADGTAVESWSRVLEEAPGSTRPGLEFLIRHLPERDAESLDPKALLAEVELAVRTRAERPWGATLPDDVFFNDVLPYAFFTEPRHLWRQDLHARFDALVRDCRTPGVAAQVLNREIFGRLKVRFSTKRERADQSPRQTIESGTASCTGLSILLAAACRSVGVPARVVGTQWVDGSGNHSWVEVWDDGGWHFIGAAEPDGRGLDHAWFVNRAKSARPGDAKHAIFATSYRSTGSHFPMAWSARDRSVPAIDVTKRYVADKD
ncbi:MAG: transglutaminase-like domain-containing protein [Planctomycetota bacterium]